MRPAIVSGTVTGDAPVSYWLNFPAPSNSPRSLRKVTRPSFFLKVATRRLFMGKQMSVYFLKNVM